jgi:hypothetical protein
MGSLIVGRRGEKLVLMEIYFSKIEHLPWERTCAFVTRPEVTTREVCERNATYGHDNAIEIQSGYHENTDPQQYICISHVCAIIIFHI